MRVLSSIQSLIDQGCPLKEQKDHLNTLNLSRQQIAEQFVNELLLFDIMYQNAKDAAENAYGPANDEIYKVFEKDVNKNGWKVGLENVVKFSNDERTHQMVVQKVVE
jgi:hypothetical protein